jgi:hypothetical protein
MSLYLYDARAPMAPAVSAGPDRQIGVTVAQPRPHAAFGGALYSEISVAFPVLWPQALVDWQPAGAWSGSAAEFLRLIIRQIDQAMAELTAQRARLAAEIERLVSDESPAPDA